MYGTFLRSLRRSQNLTQQQLAALLRLFGFQWGAMVLRSDQSGLPA